ncbi:YdcF family protein, partial [Roseobacter sp. HKCCA0434]|uniref:YdcF family protein n=1 Tax=Roseobacter sp. HKCCA0434 TaxID=3079297 RepID=UPI002905C912
ARVAGGVAALGPPPQVLHLTGGLASGGSEAVLMADHAQALGVPPERISREDASRTTFQNALLSRAVLGRGARIVLVTDGFHLARAALLFRAAGFRLVALRRSAHEVTPRRARWYFFREGLSFALNTARVAAWWGSGLLGLPERWRMRLT